MGRPKKHTKAASFEWTDDEDQAELDNDLDIWRSVCGGLTQKLDTTPEILEGLLMDTYGAEYHWQGILAMPARQLLRDLLRTRRLKAQGVLFEDSGALPVVSANDFPASELAEAGLSLFELPESEADQYQSKEGKQHEDS